MVGVNKTMRDARILKLLDMTTNCPMSCRELYNLLQSTNKKCGVTSVKGLSKILPRFKLLTSRVYQIAERMGKLSGCVITLYQVPKEDEHPDEVISNEGDVQEVQNDYSQQPIPVSQLQKL